MENYSVYEDIANRTGGDIYIGVVGPVRTGKSTFIRRFMETLVLPSVPSEKLKEMTDELPQAAAGKTVMTTEPKFVPAKAAKIQVAKGANASVRLVDCVGFAVDGASGFEEDGAPRLVKTPWQETPMPFEQAAALGTEKVIREHSTIGVLLTTDGSITDIPRSAYIAAEERAVAELKTLEKPFVIVLNCKKPSAQSALKKSLEEKYGAPVLALNVENMSEEDICEVLQKALLEFPLVSIDVSVPKWLQSFDESNRVIGSLMEKIRRVAPTLQKMRDLFALEKLFEEKDDFYNPDEIKMDLGRGQAELSLSCHEDLFYRVLSEECGETIDGELGLMRYVCALAETKNKYDKIKDAFKDAEEYGYGIVCPTASDYELEKPSLSKKSAGYGVKFKANATSYHIVKVDVSGVVNPIIGTKQQGDQFLDETLKAYEEDSGELWETNIFGRSLRALVGDELSSKSDAMPAELKRKMRKTMTRIVNDGKNNCICLLF